MVTKHKYFGAENTDRQGFCVTGGKPPPGAATHPCPDSKWEGRVFPPDCNPTVVYQDACRSPGGAGISLRNAGKTTGMFHGGDTFANTCGQPASILCGNSARFPISAPRCIAEADDCVLRLRERTAVLWKSGLQSLGVYDSAWVCLCVCVVRDVHSVLQL